VRSGDPPPKLLGMPIGPCISEAEIFHEPLSKLRKSTHFLSRFHLSYVAKAVLFNTRILPVFLYRARLCFCPNIHKMIKKVAEEFLWSSSSHARISWNKLVLPVADGGLNIVDPGVKIISAKTAWLVRSFRNSRESAWRAWFFRALFYFCIKHQTLQPLALSARFLNGRSVTTCFVSQVLLCWVKYCSVDLKPGVLVQRSVINQWSADLLIFLASPSPARLSSLYSRFVCYAVRAPADSNVLTKVWSSFCSRSVYRSFIKPFLTRPVPPKPFSPSLSNYILTCDSVDVRVRQFWFLVRHNSLFPLARLMHFVPTIKSDICPLCKLCREDMEHALCNCIFLRPLWRSLESFFDDQGFHGIMMNTEFWSLCFVHVVPGPRVFPSPSCLLAIGTLHYYHWKEREFVIKSDRPYNLNSVLSKWHSHR
jgi:hypothetical protein